MKLGDRAAPLLGNSADFRCSAAAWSRRLSKGGGLDGGLGSLHT